jgi:hypothetical protein
MSVDHYQCDGCGRTFADCCYTATWCDCGGKFCSKECAAKDDEDCCLCRIEVVRDADLLSFLLKHCKITRTQAIKMYKEKHDG